MTFTQEQYEKAIERLQAGLAQLQNGDSKLGCDVCGDSCCHPGLCRFNPLRAMAMCEAIFKEAGKFHDRVHAWDHAEALTAENESILYEVHEFLHWLAGFDPWMGEPLGPMGIGLPLTDEEEAQLMKGTADG